MSRITPAEIERVNAELGRDAAPLKPAEIGVQPGLKLIEPGYSISTGLSAGPRKVVVPVKHRVETGTGRRHDTTSACRCSASEAAAESKTADASCATRSASTV